MARATVVLVHGAFHNAWYWDDVVRGLGERGITALAPDLPGHGDDPRPLGDLHEDAAAVQALLDTIDGDVVLVGHSYGGMVITEAGEHLAVAHMVYLAAYLVDETESTANAAATDPDAASIDRTGRPDIGRAITVAGGIASVDPAVAGPILYAGLEPRLAAGAVARLEGQRARSLAQTPTAVAWRSHPTTCVVATEDLTIHPQAQRIMARRATRSMEWETGHFPMLTHPHLVIDLLAEIASDPSG
jgi:pimeloyl-ACP methyl ester carboxylesterase